MRCPVKKLIPVILVSACAVGCVTKADLIPLNDHLLTVQHALQDSSVSDVEFIEAIEGLATETQVVLEKLEINTGNALDGVAKPTT